MRRGYTPPRMQPKLKRGELDRLAEFYSLDAATRRDHARARRCASLARRRPALPRAAACVSPACCRWPRAWCSSSPPTGADRGIRPLRAGRARAASAAPWSPFVKPPPRFVGRGAVFLAFIATGALLALFGQTYQTGADVYELFLTWALLGLPLVVAAQWSVSVRGLGAGAQHRAAAVLRLATRAADCSGPCLAGRASARRTSSWARPGSISLLWFAFEWRQPDAVPDWVRRLLLSCAFGFATWAGVIVRRGRSPRRSTAASRTSRSHRSPCWRP